MVDFGDLASYIMDQGVDHETACDLANRKMKSPRLTGVSVGGKWISLSPASGVLFDQMVESGVPPQSVSDVEFLKGRFESSGTPRNERFIEKARRVAEKAGVSTTGKVRIGQLCRPGMPYDPQAWVSGRGDVQARLEERGEGSSGLVNVKARALDVDPQESKPAVGVSERIVTREAIKELTNQIQGEAVTVTKREFLDQKEKTRAKLMPSWKKKGK